MRFSGPESGDTAGFSLIEVLVALVITGLALAAIAGAFGGGLQGHQVSEQAATALALAEEKIAAAGTVQTLRPGSIGGEFGGRYRWRLTIAPYEDRPDNSASAFDRSSVPLRLYRIEAEVAWRDGLRRRQLTVAALRLGPAPP